MESYHRKQERLLQDNSDNSDVVFDSHELEMMLENMPKDNESITGSLLSNMKPPSKTFVYNKNGSKRSSKENNDIDFKNIVSRRSTHSIRSQKSYVYKQSIKGNSVEPLKIDSSKLDLAYDLINTNDHGDSNLLKTINNDSYIGNNNVKNKLQSCKIDQFNSDLLNDDNILGSDINPILKTINKFSLNDNNALKETASTQKNPNNHNNYINSNNQNSGTETNFIPSQTRLESFLSPSENKLEKLKLEDVCADKLNKFHSSTEPCFNNETPNHLENQKEKPEQVKNPLNYSFSIERRNRHKKPNIEYKDNKSLVQTERVYYKKSTSNQIHNFIKKKSKKIRISQDENEKTPKNTAVNTPKVAEININNTDIKSQTLQDSYNSIPNTSFNSVLKPSYVNLNLSRPNLSATEPTNIDQTKRLYVPMKNCKMITNFDLVGIGNDQFILSNKEDYYTLVAALTLWRDENFKMNDQEYSFYVKELKNVSQNQPKLPPLSGKKIKSNIKNNVKKLNFQQHSQTERIHYNDDSFDPFQQDSVTILDPERENKNPLEISEYADSKNDQSLNSEKQTNIKKKLCKYTELRGRKNSIPENPAIIEEEEQVDPEKQNFLKSALKTKKNDTPQDPSPSLTERVTTVTEVENQSNPPSSSNLGNLFQTGTLTTKKTLFNGDKPKRPVSANKTTTSKGKNTILGILGKSVKKKTDTQQFLNNMINPGNKNRNVSIFNAQGKVSEPKYLREYKALPETFWKEISKTSRNAGVIGCMVHFIGNEYIFTRDNVGFFKQWCVKTKSLCKDWRDEETSPPICLALSCDCHHIVYSKSNPTTGLSDLQVWQIWDPNREQAFQTQKSRQDIKFLYSITETHNSIICCILISWDCFDIYTSDGNGCIKQWGLYNMSQKADWGEINPCAIFSLALFRTNVRILVGSADGSLREYHTLQRKLIFDYGKVHNDRIMCIKINKRGRFFFTAGDDLKLMLFNSKEKKCVKVWNDAHDSPIHSMWWSDDQLKFWTIAKDNTVKDWDVEKRKCFYLNFLQVK